MNKEKFKELATETQARKCLHFNWLYIKNKSCIRLNPELCPCVKLNGEECKYYTKGVVNG